MEALLFIGFLVFAFLSVYFMAVSYGNVRHELFKARIRYEMLKRGFKDPEDS